MATWRESLAIYRNPRLIAVFGQGFASGLPLPLTTTTLTYWLARDGVDKTAIGLFTLLGLPYAFKFLWAPLLDQLRPPGLASLGRRRGWILLHQAALVLAIAALGAVDPSGAPFATGIAVLAVALLSASQDVVVDAYRIEVLADHEQGSGAAATQAGYRAGMLASGAGAIALADFASWPETFGVLACAMALAMLFVVFAREPERAPPAARAALPGTRASGPSIGRAFLDPVLDLLERPRWPLILAFAVLYKLGDSIALSMSNPFFVELGFSGVEIASITKLVGLAASVVGIVVGGILVAQTSILRALALGGILQAATNLLYAGLAGTQHDVAFLTTAIVADYFTGGLASAAFVAYFSSLSRGAFSGTQFALLTSLMAMGRTLAGGASGWMADAVAWPSFWAATAALALPGLLLLTTLPEPRDLTGSRD